MLKRHFRAFPTENVFYLYFITLKSYFSILIIHFYKTSHISFSILQYIILKYYEIIFIFFIYFFSHSNQTHDNHHRSHHSWQPPKTHSRLLNNGNHPIPTHASSTTATTHNPHTHAGKPKPTTTIPTLVSLNPPQPILSATTAEKGERNQPSNPMATTQTQTPSKKVPKS